MLDVQWMEGYLRDEIDAFGKIYAAYSPAVYGYLAKRVSQLGERDDLFQKIWMKFHRSRESWSSEYSLLQWLFVISRSILLDQLRELKRSPQGNLLNDAFLFSKIPAGIDSEILAAESAAEEDELSETLVGKGLTPEQVNIIRSHVFQEEEYAAIALRLGKSAVSVRKIFSRAMEKLRKSAGNTVFVKKGKTL